MSIGSTWNAGSAEAIAGEQRHTGNGRDRVTQWVQTCGGCGEEIGRYDEVVWTRESGVFCVLCSGEH